MAGHRNANTCAAYANAVRQFAACVARQRFRLQDLSPVHIAAYVEHIGRNLETAQLIACHKSPRTTPFYDRRSDEVTLDEIERIQFGFTAR